MKHAIQRQGSVIVELSLMMGILMLILMGTIDVARVFYAAVTVVDASRAGAQWGIRSNGFTSDTSGMQEAAAYNAQDIGTVTSSPERYCRCEGGSGDVNCMTGTCAEGVPQIYIRVETESTFSTLFGYPGLPDVIPLSDATTFRVQ